MRTVTGGLKHSHLVDIIRGAAEGETIDEAAIRLGIDANSVSHRRRAAYTRFGARNAPHAVAIAYRKGWLA